MCNAIIVHNLEHAMIALSVAEELQLHVTLISPPNAAATLGATVFRDIISKAAEEHPNAKFFKCANIHAVFCIFFRPMENMSEMAPNGARRILSY